MRTAAPILAVLLLATAAHAQTGAQTPQQTPPAARPGSDLTRDLNSGPPRPATYLAPEPAPVQPTPAPVPTYVPPTPPAATTPRPTTPTTSGPTRPATTSPAPSTASPRPAPAPTRPAATSPAPSAPAARPATAPPASATPRPTAPAATTPAPAPEPSAPVVAPTPPPPAPNVPTVTVLDAAARAALPFAVDLPQGFEIVTGRPGPDFRIYTIRRGERSFVMVYAGPASQFPIYSGEMVEAGGRASVIATDDGGRHAVEHLFQRPVDPREIHVWTMTLDGADRVLAERIAQSVDVR